MSKFAATTTVPIEKSRGEIEAVLSKYGACMFMYGTDSVRNVAVIQFRAKDRDVKFLLPLPSKSDPEFLKTPTGIKRPESEVIKLWEQACRQRWRALLLCIRAKLESIQSGITHFEDEFLAHIVLPDGNTVGETIKPKIAIAYQEGLVKSGIAGFLGSN